MATADLHFHSTCSDGKHPVSWLIQTLDQARSSGLGFAVLTDHDGFEGFEEFAHGVKGWWRPICASELSCTFQLEGRERELHLLIYGLDPRDALLLEKVARFREERAKRFYKIADKLRDAGFALDVKSIVDGHPGVLGRPHIADALVQAGVVKSRIEAFEKFLKSDGRFYVKKWRFPLEEAVAYAKSKACKTSVAHPGSYDFREKELAIFKAMGVDAIEVYHPRHTLSEHSYYDQAAKRFGFKISGGSDFHMDESDRIGKFPSLGRSPYPLSEAERFLKDFL
jgi:predicted metal-dependent phosphoesterase TrpH